MLNTDRFFHNAPAGTDSFVVAFYFARRSQQNERDEDYATERINIEDAVAYLNFAMNKR